MRHYVLVLLKATLLFGTSAQAQNISSVQGVRTPVVTSQGSVIGLTQKSGQQFLGIPYAAPPVDELRWKAPQPIDAWDEPRDATQFGNICPQQDFIPVGSMTFSGYTLGGETNGAEDCLYLNIYAPPGATASSKLPVMVWIHGGLYFFGAGSNYDGSVLAQNQQVVVVTMNYRLGPLGFLAAPALSAESPDRTSGNYGLMDQQAALRWVQSNIAPFGGDPSNVTIFGESAGGMSICYQLASPNAAGLFHKAIIQSGLCSSINNSVSIEEATQRGSDYTISLGCEVFSAHCLRRQSPAQLATLAVPSNLPLGSMGWLPIYGDDIVPISPQVAFQTGAVHRVPLINGTNHDEGRFFRMFAPTKRPMPADEYWGGMVWMLGISKALKVIREYPITNFTTPALAFATAVTDAVFSCSAAAMNTALSTYMPVYSYEFNDVNTVSMLPSPPDFPGLGSYHTGELVYIFQTPLVVPSDDSLLTVASPTQFTMPQRALSDSMQRYWGNFAKTGNPNGKGLPVWANVQGHKMDVQEFSPVSIGVNTNFFAAHKCDFWQSLEQAWL